MNTTKPGVGIQGQKTGKKSSIKSPKAPAKGKKASKKSAKTLKAPAKDTKSVPVSAPTSSHVTLTVDATKHDLDKSTLDDDVVVNVIVEQCKAAKQPPKIDLTRLVNIPDEERLLVLDFIRSLPCKLRFTAKTFSGVSKTVFPVVLSALVNGENLELHGKAKEAALATVALFHDDAIEAACGQIAERLISKGVKGIRTAELLAKARGIAKVLQFRQEHLATHGSHDAHESRAITDIFEDAPVAAEVMVPDGWGVSTAGIVQSTAQGDRPVASAPVLINGRFVDRATDQEFVKLAHRRDGQWREQVVPRKDIADRRSIVQLAAHGMPVTSNNAGALVQYLADFEAANIDHLPRSYVSGKLGWQAAGQDGFLLGHLQITGNGEAGTGTNTVIFKGGDAGDDQIAACFVQAGKFGSWSAAIDRVKIYPPVALGLVASFAAPLLAIFKSPNFVFEFAGQTTQGKTTALRIAASVWGNPNERSPDPSVVHTWDGTRVARARIPAVSHNLPFFLDDTKRVKDRQEVVQTIYDVASGRGRDRGSKQGLAAQDACSTVLFSTGEAPATSFSQDGGTRARVLTVWGSPFKLCAKQPAKLVRQVNDTVFAHFGHAGRCWIEFLVEHRAKWPSYRKRYQNWVSTYEKWAADRVPDNSVANRLAAHFAALTVTAELVQEAGIVTWALANPVEPLWEDLVLEGAGADRAAAALAHVISWATGHQAEFYSTGTSAKAPFSGWLGRWEKGQVPAAGDKSKPIFKWLGILPDRLKKVLSEGGYEVEPILRTWKDRGYLKCNQGRNQCKTRVGEHTTWVVAIQASAVHSAHPS